jgi:hypothetical protein
MTRPPRRVDRQLVVRVVGTLGSLALLVYLLSQQGWDEILAALRRIPGTSLIAVLGLLALSRLAITSRWYSLLHSTDPTIRFRDSLRLTLAGLFSANFLPTTVGGDVVRLAGVLRLSRNRAGSAASIVADRLIGLAGMAMVLPIGLRDLVLWLQAGNLGLGLPTIAMASGGEGAGAPSRWSGWWRRGRRALEKIAGELAMWVRHPRALLLALAFTWIHMLCLFTEIWLLLRGMGQSLSLASVGGLWSLSYFITLMPFSINGLGLREVSVTYIFSELGGVSLESALTLALILRTFDMLVSLPGAMMVSGVVTSDASDRQEPV